MGESRDTPTELAGPSVPERVAGQLIASKYKLVEVVARGGMGTVWRATDTQLERPVAIKFMSPMIAHDPSARQRFNREAKAAARLHTPHVVRIFEHGVDGDAPFIVMELLQGQDLHRRLRRERRIPLEEAARIVAQIAKGLRAAHEANIIHRDLKPHNIFLANVDGELVVKILDFGVAKMEGAVGEGTKTGVLLGSPHYMSPEQARGKSDIDHRSDVWSLAVIAFRMITGKMAFNGEGQGDVIIAIATADIPVPSHINPNLPPAIDQFFAGALQRDREKRYPSAVDLAAAFAKTVRACTEASLLTPTPGHPLHTPSADDDPPPPTLQLQTPAQYSGPFDPHRPGLAALGATPDSIGHGTPHSLPHSQPQPGATPGPTPGAPMMSLHTPATGPSIGVGNAIFSAPPAAPPPRRVLGIVAIVGVSMACLAIIFAALGTGDDASESRRAPAAEATESTPEPTPQMSADPEAPSDTSEPAGSSAAPSASSSASKPPASASARPKATPPVAAPTPKKWTPPKPKNEWDNFGY